MAQVSTVRDAAAPRTSGWHFRLLGFRIEVPWNALIAIGVIALLWYPEFTGSGSRALQLGTAAAFAVLLMGSILLHELAHGLAARAFRYPVTGITLWAMGGFTTYRTTKRHGPAREAAIALAGPATTLAVAALALVGARGATGQVHALLAALGSANLLVGIFNLLPGSPLDGGAVVKAVVWAVTGSPVRGQLVSGWVGRGLAVLVVALPLLVAARTGEQPSLIGLVIGVMLGVLLWSGASATLQAASAARSLDQVSAVGISQPVDFIPATATVASAVALMRPGIGMVAMDESRRAVGVVSAEAARAVPAEQAARVPVLSVCATLDPDTPVVPAHATAKDVLDECQRTGSRFVVVSGAQGEQPRLVDTDAAFVTDGP